MLILCRKRKKSIFASIAAVLCTSVAIALVIRFLVVPSKSTGGSDGSSSSGAADGVGSTPVPSRTPTIEPPGSVPTSIAIPGTAAPRPTIDPPGSVPTSIAIPGTAAPRAAPSIAPSGLPSLAPSEQNTTTIFCVIADAPYDDDEADDLLEQIPNVPTDCEFLIHLGDITDGDSVCKESEYTAMRDMLDLSKIVSLVVVGDNEFNDCPDPDVAMDVWHKQFVGIEGNWTHNLNIVRKPDRPANFYFVRKGTLFIGLNIPGGMVHSKSEWSTRLTDLYQWTEQLILEEVVTTGRAAGVIIMAHAQLGDKHDEYVEPLVDFIENTLNNAYPILYLHGDGHKWRYNTKFYSQPSFLQIMHKGGTEEPPLKMMSDPLARGPSPEDAFWFER